MQSVRTKNSVKRCRGILLLALFILALSPRCFAQEIVDKMVATVSSGARANLITYSDLLWQLALQPGTPLTNPGSEELNRALNLIINQRLILQEAEKLPPIAPTDAEVEAALKDLINKFASREEFYERVKRVGLSAEQLREIIRQRVAIDKYLDFRFRSFTIVTPQEVADYYRDVFVPRFRRQSPGQLVPELEKVRDQIERTLLESKIESETDAFLDAARENAEIVILNPV
jgi:SurA N-terminal domain